MKTPVKLRLDMNARRKTLRSLWMGALLLLPALAHTPSARADDAIALVKGAIEYWRDESSYMEARMLVHRPDWQREMALRVWTRGNDQSLVRFTEPAKDAGSASLTIEDETWTFSPKVNKIIKIPPSMKSQSWMGSDFSYEDLSKDDSLLEQYDHRIVGEETSEGKRVQVVESVPRESAPVVWGKEVLLIRDDHIILRHDFFDQDGKLVKRFESKRIEPVGGKLYPTVTRITKVDAPEEWTEVRNERVRFGLGLPDSLFTQSNLQNPRADFIPRD